jgi:hypothetical protein
MEKERHIRHDYKKYMEKLILTRGYDPVLIAKKTYEFYVDHASYININSPMHDILLDVATMENGPEYEMTEEEFKKILAEI